VDESFARVCPTHHRVLEEGLAGELRCESCRRNVQAWIVVNLTTREVVAAGRLVHDDDSEPAIWLGAWLREPSNLAA
jgi:hypothetical protein